MSAPLPNALKRTVEPHLPAKDHESEELPPHRRNEPSEDAEAHHLRGTIRPGVESHRNFDIRHAAAKERGERLDVVAVAVVSPHLPGLGHREDIEAMGVLDRLSGHETHAESATARK